MSDLEDEIRALREKWALNHRQFLELELETCFIAIERAQLELSLGNTHESQKEFVVASHGADVVERFLRKAAMQMPDIEARLSDLRSSLASLRTELDTGLSESSDG